jgi:hypothetical protein
MTLPPSSVISAVRFSHSIWSKGLMRALLNTRLMRRALLFFVVIRDDTILLLRREDELAAGAEI